jgi:hypothetical protein
MKLFEKIHNIVVYIRDSAGRTKEFKELIERMILFDNRTKWNGWYYIFIIAIKHADAIDSYIKKYFDIL